MIGQRRDDGGVVVSRNGLAKRKFRSQQARTLLKLIALLVEQAKEDAFAHAQFLHDGFFGDLDVGSIEHQQGQPLYNYQQGGEKHHDAGAQTVERKTQLLTLL